MNKLISLVLTIAALAVGQSAWAQTFEIKASYNSSNHKTTFTITRSGSSLPQQTINYRTVNLSAYAGQHYTAVNDTYTFPANETTKTVEVTEGTPSSNAYAYMYQQSDSRTYRFEVLDINGFELQHYDRSMTTGVQFTNTYVNSSVTDLVYFSSGGSIMSGSGNKYMDVSYSSSNWTQVTDAGYDQGVHTISTNSLYNNNSNLRNILNNLSYKMYATVYFTQKEEHDGYQYIQIYTGNAETYDNVDDPNGDVGTLTNSLYRACFILSKDANVMTSSHYQFFPHRYSYKNKAAETAAGIDHYEFDYDDSYLYAQTFKSNSYKASTSGSLILSPTDNNINVRFDAGGGGTDHDEWDFKNLKARLALVDATKPTLYNNSTSGITVSGGPYVKGNTFYISVPFSEIVHISGASKELETSWGTVSYLSGDYSNVITFKGTITANAGTVLAITSIKNSMFNDLAGNYDTFSTNSFDKTFTGVTCTESYTLAATNTSFSGLANEYVVNTTAIEPHPTVYFYKGIMNSSNKVQLTENTNYSLSWANNTAAGNGTVTATGAGIYNGSASTTFPIRWSTYTVSFHGNGSVSIPVTGEMSDQSFQYGVAQNLTANAFSRTGYTFAGWNTAPDGSGDSYSNEQVVTGLSPEDGANVVLYAQWTVISWTGTGDSADDPYMIIYASQLDLLSTNVNSGNTYEDKFFKLDDDITYSYEGLGENESNYTAIGTGSYKFQGTFDGNNKTISGIRIRTTSGTQGIFKYVGSNGTVKNVVLANSIFKGKAEVGGIAGRNAGILTNCCVEGSVEVLPTDYLSLWHGGIAGENSGTVSGCISAAIVGRNNMSNVRYYGGIVGENTSSGTVKDCLYTGSTVDAYNYYGAIVGNNAGTLTNNYYTTEGIWGVGVGQENPSGSDCDGARRARVITLDENIVLVGDETEYSVSGLTAIGTTVLSYTDVTTTTLYSGATQDVTLSYTGVPVTGYVFNGFTATNGGTVSGNTLTMPAADVSVSATFTDVWGVTNTPAADGSENHPYMITTTAGLDLLAKNVNGTDGYTANDFSGKFFKLGANIEYDPNELDANGENYTAIGGYIDNNIRNFRGTFDGDGKTISGIRIYKGGGTSADGYQGLFGNVSGGTIKNVTLTDAVITGKRNVGGIAGYICENNSTGGIIENCHVTNTVTIHAVVSNASGHGGIVGEVNGGSVSGCTSAATLTMASGLTGCIRYGGIVGDLNGNMQNCLVVGANVSGTDKIGAVAGDKDEGSTLTNNYYTADGPGGVNGSDCDGARRARVITLGEGVALVGDQTTYNVSGLTAIGSGNYVLSYNDGTTTTLYSGATQDVTLSYTSVPATGYVFNGFTATNGGTVSGNTLTMPAADVSVSATFTDVWGMADGADGSSSKPYKITSTAGLDLLAKNVNGTDGYTANNFSSKLFKLGADIAYTHTTEWDDATSTENNYTAIGNNGHRFMGTFDGDNHTISGIRIYKGGSTDADRNQGLFGYVYYATIKNVILSEARITGYERVGGIVGYFLYSNIQNCLVINTAITGTSTSTAINAIATGAVVGYKSLGDLSHNYYHNCTVKAGNTTYTTGIGLGAPRNDYENEVSPAYTLTLGDDISATATVAVNYNSTGYYTAGTEVTLSYSGTVPEGYMVTYSYNDGTNHTITGNSFEMPAADVTVSASFTPDIVTHWHADADHDGTTKERAYIITTPAGLNLLASEVNGGNDFYGKFFKLDDDIAYTHTTDWNDATSTENNYTAIGGLIESNGRAFRGTFDGDNHTISGIRIYKGGSTNGDRYQGLFGYINDATIKNVILSETRITGYERVGGIVGYFQNNNIQNCLVINTAITGTSTSTANNAIATGAVVGYKVNGTLSHNYYHNCTVKAGNTTYTTGIGLGAPRNDYENEVSPAYTLSLGTDISATPAAAVSYNNIDYYTAGTEVTLSYTGTVPEGYMVTYSYNDGTNHTVTGNSFTMPAADVTVSATFDVIPWEGSGNNEDDPYIILYRSQLDLLATNVNNNINSYSGKFFKLGADIAYDPTDLDANGENYTAIGTFNSNFRGTFDGDNHTISGIRINKTGETYDDQDQALFGYVNYATIKNVILSDAHITGCSQVGGIVGDLSFDNTIKNCLVLNSQITATSNTDNCGVIIGFYSDSATLTDNYYYNCSLTQGGNTYTTNIGTGSSSVTDRNGARGVNKLTLGADISATPAAAVTYQGNGYYVAGTTVTLSVEEGYTAVYTVKDAANNDVTLTGGDTFVMPATDVTVSADLTMIAMNGSGTEDDPYIIMYRSQMVQLVGITIQDGEYYKLGRDLSYSYAGLGEADSNYTSIFVCRHGHFDGDGHTISGIRIYSTQGSEGLFSINYGTVKNVTLTDAVITGDNYVGGIAGINDENGIIENCHVTSTVIIKAVGEDACALGGIAGYSGGNDDDIPVIRNCTSAATITDNGNEDCIDFGGIVGQSSGSNVSGCQVLGASITGDDSVGGIVGYVNDNKSVNHYSIIGNCVVIGCTITCNGNDKGAIVGDSYGGTFKHNYYYGCTVNGTANATNVGREDGDINDEENPEGAVHTNGIPLLDNSNNDFVITTYNGVADQDYTLVGRTLTKTGAWNTLCLPFALSNFTGTPLEGATVKELDVSTDTDTSLNTDNGLLTLKFKEATSIEAGKPYIVKWTTTGDNITNPTFTDVTITSTAPTEVKSNDGNVKFVGQYNPFDIDDSNINSILFVGSGSQIGYSQNPRILRSFRAHFWVQPNGDGSPAAQLIDVDWGEGSTGIREIEAYGPNGANEANGPYKTAWYSLDGRKLQGKPTAKGLFIHGGKKTVIK